MNLVKLHSFRFIHSFKATHPNFSGVQAIPELSSHSHPSVFICATATSQMWQLQQSLNYLPALLSLEQPPRHMAGASQAYMMDITITGVGPRTTKWFLHTREFLLHSFDSWAIWHIPNKPQFAYLFRTEEITLLQGTINYALTTEIMKWVLNFFIDIWALYKCKEYFSY